MSSHTCELCRKSFDQETQYDRHIQYCRRRAARKQPARPAACNACRSTKNKCDFHQPCSRCAAKQIECIYGRVSGTSQIQTTSSNPPMATALTPGEQDPTTLTGDHWTFDGDQMDLGLVSHEDYNYSDTLFHPPANFLSTIETLFAAPPTIPKPLVPNLSLQPVDLMCSVSDTHQLLSLASQPISEQKTMGQCLSPSCRRFITATLRTFPRLMAQPAKWPPFIHPLVSSLHFDEQDMEPPPTTLQPLKPLAACRVISQGFVARSEGSMDFLWRSIEAEERWIKSDMQKFSLGELLAAMQAMVIYTIMRMIDFGPDYFTENDGMIVTMQDLAYVYSSRVPGPFSPPHERKVGLRWKDWLCEEVRRRIINTCFCVALVVGTGSTQGLANPGQGPLPGPSSLWEADNEWDWAREYMRSWGPQGNGSGKLFDMCSLALAMRQRVGSEGALVAVGESRLAEDALDEWQAGLDALGMMLSTIMVDSGGVCRASIGM